MITLHNDTLAVYGLPCLPVGWNEVAGRFGEDRDCLASFLALNCAEVVAGLKPGNLINIVNRPRRCGRNLFNLWLAHGARLMAGTDLEAVELSRTENRLLLFVFHRPELSRVLGTAQVRHMLTDCGYSEPGSIQYVLDKVKERMEGPSFPHEIGILLGYPLKDVLAFMGRIDLPFTCQGPWKIYGDPSRSLILADCYRQCRHHMARRLSTCSNPVECLMHAA